LLKNTTGRRRAGRGGILPEISGLAARRIRLLVRGTLGHDGGTKFRSEIVGQLIKLRVAIDLDGFASGIAHNVAVVAPRQMVIQFGLRLGVEYTVKVVG
jgi:hypothetical protein